MKYDVKFVCSVFLAFGVLFVGGMGERTQTEELQSSAESAMLGDVDVVQPTRNARIEKLKRQKEVWSTLDRQAKKVITERAKYVYRFSDDVIIDAYEMMYWQREMSGDIVVEKIFKTNGANGMRHKKLESKKRTYREDQQLQAYFSIPTYPCLVWYKGVLVNDSKRWDADEYEEFRTDMDVAGLSSPKMISAVKKAAEKIMPCVVVIDPLASMTPERDIYSKYIKGQSGRVKLDYGIWGRFDNGQINLGSYQKNGQVFSRLNSPGFYLIPDKKLRDGKPSHSLTSYALIPSVKQGGAQSALGGGSRVEVPVRYEVHDLKRFKMNPKDLAIAFVEGEVEIPYRTGTRAGGVWIYEEQLLERPMP